MQIVRRTSSRKQHALDLPAVGEREQQLLGAVVGLRVADDAGRPEREVGGELVAQRLAEIGHLLKIAGPPREEPIANLLRAVRTLAVLVEPGGERVVDGVEEMRHAHGLLDGDWTLAREPTLLGPVARHRAPAASSTNSTRAGRRDRAATAGVERETGRRRRCGRRTARS